MEGLAQGGVVPMVGFGPGWTCAHGRFGLGWIWPMVGVAQGGFGPGWIWPRVDLAHGRFGPGLACAKGPRLAS